MYYSKHDKIPSLWRHVIKSMSNAYRNVTCGLFSEKQAENAKNDLLYFRQIIIIITTKQEETD